VPLRRSRSGLFRLGRPLTQAVWGPSHAPLRRGTPLPQPTTRCQRPKSRQGSRRGALSLIGPEPTCRDPRETPFQTGSPCTEDGRLELLGLLLSPLSSGAMAKEDEDGARSKHPRQAPLLLSLFRLRVSTLDFSIRLPSQIAVLSPFLTLCFFASTTLFARRALPFFSLAVINTSIPQVIYLYTAVLLRLFPSTFDATGSWP
jgi:hypothetical protein